MSKNRKGYIAILTNPMFKENWTKIVVCRTDAELKAACRSVELPCKFEVAEKIPIAGDAGDVFVAFCVWTKSRFLGDGFFRLSVDVAKRYIEKVAEDPNRRRENFRFSMVGIKAGESLVFTPCNITVRVASDDEISYAGGTKSLSGFYKEMTGKVGQGSLWFTYDDAVHGVETLQARRDRIEFGE